MIYVSIVNYNSDPDIVECIESLLRSSTDNFRVVVVDNSPDRASIDRTVKDLSADLGKGRYDPGVWAHLPEKRTVDCTIRTPTTLNWTSSPPGTIDIILAERNLGFAGGNNVAINYCLQDPECTHILLLNPDAVVSKELLEVFANGVGDAGLCGATVLEYSRPNTVQSCGARFNPWLQRVTFIGRGCAEDNLPVKECVLREMTYISGACTLVSRKFIERIGLMEEDYFLYYEEMDWSYRSSGKFEKNWLPDARVYHKEGTSIGSSTDGRPSDISIYYLSVNALRFNYRFSPLFVPIAAARLVVKSTVYALKGDRAAFKVGVLALRDFISGVYRKGATLPYHISA